MRFRFSPSTVVACVTLSLMLIPSTGSTQEVQRRSFAATPSRSVAKKPSPQHTNVRYGRWKRNVLDLWIPDSDRPTPWIVFIHGGGFVGGSKETIRSSGDVGLALDHGIAFASIHYRFRYPDDDQSDPQRAGLSEILRDAARAVQYLRHHARDYNLDPQRVACYGTSAGAGTSLWLAVHDDLADPNSLDPVLRESTRISAVGVINGQFSYDLSKWNAAFSDRKADLMRTHGERGRLKIHNFLGLTSAEYNGQAGAKVRRDVDMLGWISGDDPPIVLVTTTADQEITTKGIYNHHPQHARLIRDRCRQQGVEVRCFLPQVDAASAASLRDHPNLMMEFLIDRIKR